MEYQIECQRLCGFRVHARYFEQKQRFTAGLCPRCGAPVRIVEAFTDNVQPKLSIQTKRDSGEYGRIIGG